MVGALGGTRGGGGGGGWGASGGALVSRVLTIALVAARSVWRTRTRSVSTWIWAAIMFTASALAAEGSFMSSISLRLACGGAGVGLPAFEAGSRASLFWWWGCGRGPLNWRDPVRGFRVGVHIGVETGRRSSQPWLRVAWAFSDMAGR